MHYLTPIQVLRSPFLEVKDIQLLVKRDDLIMPAPSGNKWRKLKYNLKELSKLENPKLLTFGGAYSNHLHAVAVAGKRFGISTVGIVRGDKLEELNTTLSFAETCGMQLHFVDRTTYRQRNSTEKIQEWKNQFNANYVLPEGGTNSLALKGCAEVIDELASQLEKLPPYICAPCGTGGTLSGMIVGLNGRSQALGFSVLKGDFLKKEVATLLSNYKTEHSLQNWEINTDYHFGGYAKFNDDLIQFINNFKNEFDIQLEPIYTGKMFYGLFDLIKKDYFPKGTQIIALHTGGLQGLDGFRAQHGELI